MPRKKVDNKTTVKPKLTMRAKITKKEKEDAKINIRIKSRGNEELKMDLIKDEKKQKQIQKKINPELDKILDQINSDVNLQSMAQIEKEPEVEPEPEVKEVKSSVSNKDEKSNVKDDKYTNEEITKIVSNDNRKLLAEKIGALQKVEQIEVYRIVKNNDLPNNCQETRDGIWIIMNKLQNDTIIKLHKYVEFRLNSKNNLEEEKMERCKMKDKIRTGKIKNDEEFIKESQLLNDGNKVEQPSGFTNYFNGITEIGDNGDNNLKEDIEVEKNKLTDLELDNLLSERMMARKREDDDFMMPQ